MFNQRRYQYKRQIWTVWRQKLNSGEQNFEIPIVSETEASKEYGAIKKVNKKIDELFELIKEYFDAGSL